MANTSTKGFTTAIADAAGHAAEKIKGGLGIGQTEKVKQLNQTAVVDNANTHITTSFGVPLGTVDNSLKAGPRGPTLIEDFNFRDIMAHFDRERIPERVVHARGLGAHGYFEAYEDLSEFTRAAPFSQKGKKTPLFVRFSTVQGSKGSADTVRDVRGFSVKMYTEEGNWDMVGNNIPVFFIQDAIQFPTLVHSLKPEPESEVPQGQTAHDSFWDFVGQTPESTHMLFWIMSDRTLPKSLSMMQGFGVHTFRFVTADGQSKHFFKYHWRPKNGVHSLIWDEALKTNGRDPDAHRRDMWTNIEEGNYPVWELGFQIFTEEQAAQWPFDILDSTKLIPEELCPIRYVGQMVLNRNPDEFFAEVEQVAFHPGIVIPGIGFSNDPLLQGRLFSYTDAQFYRIGTNYQQLPINHPVVPVRHHQRGGAMQTRIVKGPNYDHNTVANGCPFLSGKGYTAPPELIQGQKNAERSPSFSDHHSQAVLFYNSMSPAEQGHIENSFTFELSKVFDQKIVQRVIDNLANVNVELATSIAKRLSLDPPAKPTKQIVSQGVSTSQNLSIIKSQKYDTVAGRKVAVLVYPGFSAEAYEVVAALKAAGAKPCVVSATPAPVRDASASGSLTPDYTFFASASTQFDAFFVPGGRKHVDAILADATALVQLAEGFKHLKAICAVNEGVEVLARLQIEGLAIANAASATGAVSESFGVVTAVGVDTTKVTGVAKGAVAGAAAAAASLADATAGASDWVKAFLVNIAKHKAWDREALAAKVVC